MMGDLSKELREVDYDTLVCDAEDVMTLIAKAAEALEWQPIKDAPRDVPLLLLPFDGQPCVCTIYQGAGGEAYVAIGMDIVFDIDAMFTHFMRLPQPPEGE